MKLKDRILHYYADKLKAYRTPEYDYVTSCEISGEAKGVFFTTDCITIKELKDKSHKGLINVNDILEEEFKNSECHHKKIIFCDNDRVVCIYNSKNDSYYEDIHECFENAEKRLYIKCTDVGYKTFKEYINQSSKYHEYIVYNEEIPYRKVFDKIFEEKADRSIMEDKNKESSKSIKKQINDIKKQQLENIKVNKSQIYER